MDNRKWMAEIDDNSDVFRLNMIGTHDCVTKYIRFGHFFRCQDKSIYDQLCLGVRGLDIRVEEGRPGELIMVHSIFKAYNSSEMIKDRMTMPDALRDCYRFLEENPSETIIFQFKNDSAKNMEKCFDIMYSTYINLNKDKWYLGNKLPRLKDVRGKIIFVRRCRKYEDKPYKFGTGIDFSNWVEQTAAVPEPLTLTADGNDFVIQDRFKYKPEKKWKDCVKPFLDKSGEFNGKYAINYLSTAGGLKGPYNNSMYINQMFMQYPLDSKCYYGMIYTDFPSKELADKIIMTNFKENI